MIDELNELEVELLEALKASGVELEGNMKARLDLAYHLGQAFGMGMTKGRQNLYQELIKELREKE